MTRWRGTWTDGSRGIGRPATLLMALLAGCGSQPEQAQASAQAAEPGDTAVPARRSEPSWSPDGSRIAFRGGAFPDVDIWLAGTDGSDPVRLVDHPAADDYPVWSPDGVHVLYAVNDSGTPLGWEFARTRFDGSETEFLTDDEFWKFYPEPLPDGETIVFATIRDGLSGPVQLWVMDADGSNARALFGGDR